MSELPQGWIECNIQDYAFVSNTKGVENKTPYLEIGDVNIANKNYRIKDKPSVKGCKKADKDDVLISRVRPTRGAVCIIKEDSIEVSSAFTILKQIAEVDKSFLFYQLAWNEKFLNYLGSNCTGTMYPTVSEEIIKEFIISIAPPNEQRRIVEKLDKLLARVEEAKTRLEKIPVIIKRFRQSVLNAAVTGELTKDWRKNEDLRDWTTLPFEKIMRDDPQNGLYKSQEYYGEGTLILRIDNFYDGKIKDWSELKRLKLSKSEVKSYSLDNEDIVVNRVNSMPFLGKSALVRNLSEICVFESNMMRIKLNLEKSFPEYVIRYLNSIPGLIELRKNAKHAVNQSSINQQDVKATLINLPPIEEQKEIVKRIEALFKKADEIEERYKKAKAFVDKLTQSILAKAFRGELVSQDPNDEPVVKLLERIREEKKNSELKAKKKKIMDDIHKTHKKALRKLS